MNEYDYITGAFTQTEENVNLEVDNLNVGCITSKNNSFSIDSEGNITAKSINTEQNIESLETIRDFIYPVGSVYVTNSNVDPSTLVGGTWTYIAKEFSSLMDSADVIEEWFTVSDATKVSVNSLNFVRNGTTLHIRLSATLKTDLSDTNIEVGTFNVAKLGITRFPLTRYAQQAATDSGNGIALYNLTYPGVLTLTDVVPKTDEGTIASGTVLYFDIITNFNQGYMLDSFCNKFYWKRTA